LRVAQKASKFLATAPGVKILDIGSGPGKFCLGGAYYYPKASFYGIEQRSNLVDYATAAKDVLGLDNVTFIHGNLINLDFERYDHFYFFNSFYENLPGTCKIDEELIYSRSLYNSYNRYLCHQLEKKPAGTRLVTYYCSEEEVPHGYHLVDTAVDHLLNFWIKA
jgi:SAM-dependent methyltransferase